MKGLNKKSVLLAIGTAVCIAVLVYSLYHALVIYFPQKQEQSRFDELRSMVSDQMEATAEEERFTDSSRRSEQFQTGYSPYAELKQLNSDFIGWLSVSDTDISYPVMQPPRDDPEFYLHRDFDKNDSFSGSLFIGESCDIKSDVFIVYGHNMNNGSMFGTLDSFKNDDFAREHSEIILDTMSELMVYHVFAAFQTEVSVDSTDDYRYYDNVGKLKQPAYENVVNHIRELSLIHADAELVYPQQIMLLSTCSYHTDNGRFVVAAYRVR